MRRFWLFIVGCLTALGLAGCSSNKSSAPVNLNPFVQPASGPQINPRMVQQDLMSFADRYGSAIGDVYEPLAENATTDQAKELALHYRVAHVTAAICNACDDNPVSGLLDMLVMTSLTRATAEDAWFIQMFGADSDKVIAVHKQQEGDIWQLATHYITAAQLSELRDSIERWRQEHPDQRYVSMVRLSDFSRAKSFTATGSRNPTSVFGLLFLDPFAGLDPAVREVERSRETAERVFYFLQRMPIILAGQAELASRRSLGAPQITSFLDDTSKFTDSTLRFADATAGIANSVKGFPQYMTEERQRAVEQVTQKLAEQREAAIKQTAEAVATERDAAIRQVAAAVAVERDAAIQQATTRASAQIDSATDRIGSVIQTQRTQIFQDAEATATRLIDRILWGEGIVIAFSVLAMVVGALIYRSLRSPGRESSSTAALRDSRI